MNTSASARVAFLHRIFATEGLIDNLGLLRAATQCLTSEEVKDVFIAEAGHSSDLRDAVLRRVVQEPELMSAPAIEHIAISLLDALVVADARARQSLGYCLSSLHPQLPLKYQRQIEVAFMSSRFVGLRRRGYKILENSENPDIDAIKTCWRSFGDSECGWLLVKHLDPVELVTYRSDLLPALTEPWRISRLFLRMAATQPDIVSELRDRDIISYCYVLAKLGRSVTDREARTFIKHSELDDRLGLLVWALGRMKLEKTLRWLLAELPAMQNRKTRAYSTRHGTPI